MKKKYWEDVWELREQLIQLMRKEGIWFCEKQAEVPCPIWNRIEENGAIGIVCQCNGLPTSLMTPLGEINFVRRKIGFPRTSQQEREDFMNKLQKEFRLVLEAKRNVYGDTHEVYSITRLPWSEETLPSIVEKETSREEMDKEFRKARKMYETIFHTKVDFS